MTKSEKIKMLLPTRMTTNEIAETVGCRPKYVNLVRLRNANGGRSAADLRYDSSEKGKSSRRRRIEKQQDATAAYTKALRNSGCAEEARQLARAAYASAIAAGKTRDEANLCYGAAYKRARYASGNRSAARLAAARAIAKRKSSDRFNAE